MFLESLIKTGGELAERDIKNIHSIILKNINDDFAGRYRMSNVIVSGAIHIPPKYEQLNVLMEELIYNFNNSWNKYHPIIQAVLLHGEFVRIHPFIDGNGRTAKLLLNYILMKNGYIPIIIKKEDKLEYYESLDFAHTRNDYCLFAKLITRLVIESSNFWLSLI